MLCVCKHIISELSTVYFTSQLPELFFINDDKLVCLHFLLLPDPGSTTSGVGGGHHRHQHQPQILIRTREIRLVRDGGTNNDSGYGFTLRHGEHIYAALDCPIKPCHDHLLVFQ